MLGLPLLFSSSSLLLSSASFEPGVVVVRSLAEALQAADSHPQVEDIHIAGGGQIYTEAIVHPRSASLFAESDAACWTVTLLLTLNITTSSLFSGPKILPILSSLLDAKLSIIPRLTSTCQSTPSSLPLTPHSSASPTGVFPSLSATQLINSSPIGVSTKL